MQSEEGEFLMCYQEENVQSLVILKKSQHIFDQMTQVKQTLFVWVSSQESPTLKYNQIYELQKTLDIPIQMYDCIDSVTKALNNKLMNQTITVVVSQQWQNKSIELLRKNEVKGIICFPAKKSKKIEIEDKFIISITKKQEFIEELKQHRSKAVQYRQLPTFVSMKNEIQSCNLQVMTIYAMLRLKQNKETRRMIVNQLEKLFEKLAESCYEFKHFQSLSSKFLNQIRKRSLNEQQALKWYTCESTVYKLTNSLLRSVKHPAETYYIQPFFKDLFQAVTNIFTQQNKKEQNKSFTCYRGALISQKESEIFKKNVGEIVQNLGFLSTSLGKQEAGSFFSNVWFQIEVKNLQKIKQYHFGYAHIKSKSQFYSQSQILFNPLNPFKVLQTTTKQFFGSSSFSSSFSSFSFSFSSSSSSSQYYIKLDYGIQSCSNPQNKQQSQDIDVDVIIKKWFKYYRQFNFCQGDVLFCQHSYIDGCYTYWQKCIQISRGNNIFVRKALYGLGKIYSYRNRIQQAVNVLKINKKLVRQSCGEDSSEYFNNQMLLIEIITRINKKQGFHKIKQCYNKLIKKQVSEKVREQLPVLLQTFGVICYNLKKYQQCQYIFKYALKLYQTLYGPFLEKSIATLLSYCIVLICLGKYEKAEEYFTNLPIRIKNIWGSDSAYYLQALEFRGTLGNFIGDYQTSLIFYNICRIIYERQKIKDTHLIFQAKNNIANAHFHLLNYKTALKIYEQCKKTMKGQKNYDEYKQIRICIANSNIDLCQRIIKRKKQKMKKFGRNVKFLSFL